MLTDEKTKRVRSSKLFYICNNLIAGEEGHIPSPKESALEQAAHF